ncbi:acyltransferase family protein [Carboxylicivirga sp. RSCT41]|uniref:acyltransferase family protein n=1 Tax=Carboxylicivirga agarovorans TaxID=3417570 RepID=UPI003D34A908
MNKLNQLQALRGIAAMLVCCFHAKDYINFQFPIGDILFGNGTIGVQIFFILSGFIMVYTTKTYDYNNKFKNFRTFMLKRIIRVVPLYFALTIVWLVLVNRSILFINNENLYPILKALLFIPSEQEPPLYVGWTLNYEMFFYLIFGVSLMFGKIRYAMIYGIILSLVFIIPQFSTVDFTLSASPEYFSNPYFNMATNDLLLYFLSGVFIGNIYDKIKISNAIVWLMFIISIIAFLLHYFNLLEFLQTKLLICSMLIFSVILMDVKLNLKSSSFLSYLGDISYSIYLIHPIVILIIRGVVKKTGFEEYLYTPLVFVLIIIVTLIASSVTYKYIEIKFTRLIKNSIGIH